MRRCIGSGEFAGFWKRTPLLCPYLLHLLLQDPLGAILVESGVWPSAINAFEWVGALFLCVALSTFGTNLCIFTKFYGVAKPLAFEATNRVGNVDIHPDVQISNFNFLRRSWEVESKDMCVRVASLAVVRAYRNIIMIRDALRF